MQAGGQSGRRRDMWVRGVAVRFDSWSGATRRMPRGNGQRLETGSLLKTGRKPKTKGWLKMTTATMTAENSVADHDLAEVESPADQENEHAAAEAAGEVDPSAVSGTITGDSSAEDFAGLMDDVLNDSPAVSAGAVSAGGDPQEPTSPAAAAEIPVVAEVPAVPAEPAEISELRQQVARLQTVVEEMRYADDDIVRQAVRVRELADTVQECESTAKEAKAELTAAKERLESANRELRSMIGDRASGQRRLRLAVPVSPALPATPAATPSAKTDESAPKTEETQAASAPSAPTESSPVTPDEHASSPISVLGLKQMVALAGQDAWQAAKDREEPFGMGKAELEALETAEINTIGELEEKMRADAWWHQKLPKFGEKKVQKLIESLRVWRLKFPMPA